MSRSTLTRYRSRSSYHDIEIEFDLDCYRVKVDLDRIHYRDNSIDFDMEITRSILISRLTKMKWVQQKRAFKNFAALKCKNFLTFWREEGRRGMIQGGWGITWHDSVVLLDRQCNAARGEEEERRKRRLLPITIDLDIELSRSTNLDFKRTRYRDRSS